MIINFGLPPIYNKAPGIQDIDFVAYRKDLRKLLLIGILESLAVDRIND